MKGFLPNCLGFYVTIKTFVAEHLSPSICCRMSSFFFSDFLMVTMCQESPELFYIHSYIQVNEGWCLMQCVNSGSLSPRITHCHSLPYLTLQLRDIYLSLVNYKEGTCKRTYFTIKSWNVPAKRPPFSTFRPSWIIYFCHYCKNVYLNPWYDLYTLYTIYAWGYWKPSREQLLIVVIVTVWNPNLL